MAERVLADISVMPLHRRLLDGVDDPAGGPRRRVDLAVLPCFSDERPLQGLAGLVDWRMGGRLSGLIREGVFGGGAGEAMLLPGRRTLPMARLVLWGLGPAAAFGPDSAEATGRQLVEMVERLAPSDVLMAMPGRAPERTVIEAVFDGLIDALTPRLRGRLDAVAPPAVRAVGDGSAVALSVESDSDRSDDESDLRRTPDGEVVPLGAAKDARGREPLGPGATPGATGRAGSESPAGLAPERGDAPARSPGVRPWWVVADPRHEARLRRLLDGPPRAAEQGA